MAAGGGRKSGSVCGNSKESTVRKRWKFYCTVVSCRVGLV